MEWWHSCESVTEPGRDTPRDSECGGSGGCFYVGKLIVMHPTVSVVVLNLRECNSEIASGFRGIPGPASNLHAWRAVLVVVVRFEDK